LKKILVIKYRPTKEFVHSFSAFNAIRNHHKNDHITLLTEESLVALAKKSGFFNEVWLDSLPDWIDIPGVIDIVRRLRAGGFDRVYDLQNSKRSQWYFRLIGKNKPEWSGAIPWCSHPYTPNSDAEVHIEDKYSEQLKIAGIKQTPMVDLSHLASDISRFNLNPKSYVMICPTTKTAGGAYQWDLDAYSDLVDYLYKSGLVAVLVGKNEDYYLLDYIHEQAPLSAPINLAGKTSVMDIIGLAKNAKFVIGNDTASTHIAALTGVPTIFLLSRFSPSELVAPRTKNVTTIEEPVLSNLPLDRVISAIEKLVY
jgi:ADP-heptose:LPS heptosyltransferase